MANSKPQPLIDHATNRALWEAHDTVAAKARAARACRRCSQEAGFIATDGPSDPPRKYAMHPQCKQRIGSALGSMYTTWSA
jgi:hypothetical protein